MLTFLKNIKLKVALMKAKNTTRTIWIKLLCSCAIIILFFWILYISFDFGTQNNLSSLEYYENNSILKTTEQVITSTSTNDHLFNPEKRREHINSFNKSQSIWKYLLKNNNKFIQSAHVKPDFFKNTKNIQNNQISEQSVEITGKFEQNLTMNRANEKSVEDIERKVTDVRNQISEFFNAISEDIGKNIVDESGSINTQSSFFSENSDIAQQNVVINNKEDTPISPVSVISENSRNMQQNLIVDTGEHSPNTPVSPVSVISENSRNMQQNLIVDTGEHTPNTPISENSDIGQPWSDKEIWYGFLENHPELTEDEKIEFTYKGLCEANDQEKGIGSAREFPTMKPSMFSIQKHRHVPKSAKI